MTGAACDYSRTKISSQDCVWECFVLVGCYLFSGGGGAENDRCSLRDQISFPEVRHGKMALWIHQDRQNTLGQLILI